MTISDDTPPEAYENDGLPDADLALDFIVAHTDVKSEADSDALEQAISVVRAAMGDRLTEEAKAYYSAWFAKHGGDL